MNSPLKPPVMPFEVDVTDVKALGLGEKDLWKEYRAGLMPSGDIYITGSHVEADTGKPIEIECMPLDPTDPGHNEIAERLRRVIELLPLDDGSQDSRVIGAFAQ